MLVVAVGLWCFWRARRREPARARRTAKKARQRAKRRVLVTDSDSSSDDDDDDDDDVAFAADEDGPATTSSCWCTPCFASLIAVFCGTRGTCACLARCYCRVVRWCCIFGALAVVAVTAFTVSHLTAATSGPTQLPPHVNPAIVEWQRLYELSKRR